MKGPGPADRALAREIGRALGEIGGRRDDPWVAEIAAALDEISGSGSAGAQGGEGREKTREDTVLELKARV